MIPEVHTSWSKNEADFLLDELRAGKELKQIVISDKTPGQIRSKYLSIKYLRDTTSDQREILHLKYDLKTIDDIARHRIEKLKITPTEKELETIKKKIKEDWKNFKAIVTPSFHAKLEWTELENYWIRSYFLELHKLKETEDAKLENPREQKEAELLEKLKSKLTHRSALEFDKHMRYIRLHLPIWKSSIQTQQPSAKGMYSSVEDVAICSAVNSIKTNGKPHTLEALLAELNGSIGRVPKSIKNRCNMLYPGFLKESNSQNERQFVHSQSSNSSVTKVPETTNARVLETTLSTSSTSSTSSSLPANTQSAQSQKTSVEETTSFTSSTSSTSSSLPANTQGAQSQKTSVRETYPSYPYSVKGMYSYIEEEAIDWAIYRIKTNGKPHTLEALLDELNGSIRRAPESIKKRCNKLHPGFLQESKKQNKNKRHRYDSQSSKFSVSVQPKTKIARVSQTSPPAPPSPPPVNAEELSSVEEEIALTRQEKQPMDKEPLATSSSSTASRVSKMAIGSIIN